LTSNQNFVNNLYQELLGRPADPSGMSYYSGQLDQGGSRAQVIQQIMGSNEYHTDVVQQLYQKYLHRSADSSGLATYVAFLNNGGTIADLRTTLLASDEYFLIRSGGDNIGFLANLYQDVLGRPIDA